jgi:hypothetical protein
MAPRVGTDMADKPAMNIVADLLARELSGIDEEAEQDKQEWLEETDWMPKKDRAVTYQTRPIDRYKGNERVFDRKRRVVRMRLYDAATLLLRRSGS